MDLSKEYDSYEALVVGILNLDNLNQLVTARHKAGYERQERLNEWIILGRFVFDTCGNFSILLNKSDSIIPAEKYPNSFLKIMTLPDLFGFLEAWASPGTKPSICSSPSWIPKAYQICPVCNKGWTVDNCHDFVDSHDSQIVDLAPYVGKTIAFFKTDWNKSPKVYWRLQLEHALQNNRYIDLSIPDNAIGHRYLVPVNKLGWVNVKDDHIIEKGDKALVNIWTFYHHECYRTRQAKMEKAFFKRIFQRAGFTDLSMTQIPNQYHGGDCTVCAPWYQVKADGTNFTIGWRKRVINIESPEPKINMAKLFPDEDVTKGKDFIHAWGRKKCIEYLQKIRTNI
jgi:hypothetical protein